MVVGAAGLLYGLIAVLLVYRDSPIELQAFIVAGVAVTGASIGWLVAVAASVLFQKRWRHSSLAA